MSDSFNNTLDALQDSELGQIVGGMDVRIGQVSSTVGSGSTFGSLLQGLVSSVIDGLNQAALNQSRQQQDRGTPQ